MECLIFNQIFSTFFVFWGLWRPRPTGGSVPVWTQLVTEPTLLSLSETNSWLRPWSLTRGDRRDTAVESDDVIGAGDVMPEAVCDRRLT